MILVQPDDFDPQLLDSKTPLHFYEETVSVSEKTIDSKRNILLVNWNEDTHLILRDLKEYLAPGSSVDIALSSDKLSNIDEVAIKKQLNIVRDFIVEDDFTQDFFRKVGLDKYNSIVLLSDNIIPDINMSNLSDAKSMITLLQIRLVLKELNKNNIPVVSQIQNPKNKDLMDTKNSYTDVIISNKLIGNYTCMLAENPRLQKVFNEILQPDGSEFYIRDIEDYILPDSAINFYTLVKSGVKRNDLILGYKIESEESEENHGIYINPKKSKEIKFSKGDKVIVLAEN